MNTKIVNIGATACGMLVQQVITNRDIEDEDDDCNFDIEQAPVYKSPESLGAYISDELTPG